MEQDTDFYNAITSSTGTRKNILKSIAVIRELWEAHLHLAAQSRMGKFLECLADAGVQLIVETHSEHIIDGARVQAALTSRTDGILIYFFSKESGNIQIDEIQVDANGELSKWPKGFLTRKNGIYGNCLT